MSDSTHLPTEEILAVLRRIEGVLFAGQLGPVRPAASCSCQNCGCDSRAGEDCVCNPQCACFMKPSGDRLDWALDPALGVATVLPLDDIKTLIQLREKLTEGIRKGAGK
jgi:hypothetical protein